jgi:hypothetical protein
MFVFLISQLIGLCLFLTLNYGLLSYVQYRKNQAAGKADQKVEWFVLQNARVGIYLFFVFGVLNRMSAITENLNIDYSHIIISTLFSTPEISLLPI